MTDDESSRRRGSRRRYRTVLLVCALVIAGLALAIGQEARLKQLARWWGQPDAEPVPPGSVVLPTINPRDAPFSTQGMILTLAPGEGAEIIASMAAGDAFVFAWISNGGPVSVDLHGVERGDDPDAITSFHEAEEAQDGFGHFVAPFDGTHGWYWHNDGEAAVTISVTVSGYFKELFVEDGEHFDSAAPNAPSRILCCATGSST